MSSNQNPDQSPEQNQNRSVDDHRQSQGPEANFSTLILSIASSAAMALGLAPDPSTQKIEKNLEMARFNIDLLIVLQKKTVNNLDGEESRFLESVIRDLQLKYIQKQ